MANFSIMADVPNPVFDSNGNPFSGAVLKAFLPGGSTTVISIAIDEDGGSPQASITYNAQGKLEVSGNEILPYIDQKHKWGIFANAVDAAANTPFYMGPFDDVPAPSDNSNLDNRIDRLNPATLAIAIADATLQEGDLVHTKDFSAGLPGGSGFFEVVLLSSTTGGAATGLREFASTGGQSPALALVLQLENGMYTGRQIGTGSTTVVQYFNKDDINIFNLSDGSSSAQSHVFFLPLDIRRDSHSFIVSPETAGGTCDHLFRRSLGGSQPDTAGNRYAFNFTESADNGVTPDNWSFTFATTDSGSPSFDAAYSVVSGTAPEFNFVALAPKFMQGWSVKSRSGGTFEYQHVVGNLSNEFKDKTSGNSLGTVDKDGFVFANLRHTSLLIPTTIAQPSNTFSEIYGDLQTKTLPNTEVLFDLVGATNYSIVIEMMVAFTASGGAQSFRKTTWTYDGTTLTAIDVVDTLPVQVTADIIINATAVELSVDYTGGFGGGNAMAVRLDWVNIGR